MRYAVLLFAACSSTPTSDDPTVDAPGVPEETPDGEVVPNPDTPLDSPHLALGVPMDGSPGDDHLVIHDQMALGYNRYLNAPNWVSWRTRPEDFGPTPRYEGNFYPDETLPADWFHADHADLYSSGFDRGHMLRSEERTRTAGENFDTFVMTNVLPQRADLNRGPWFDFELYVQRKVQSATQPRDAYVIAGGIWPPECATHAPRVDGDGCADVGRSTDPTRRIAVPSATWKVAVFVDAGVPPLSPDAHPYVVAVKMPNVVGIADAHWYDFRATIAEIEAASGYDLPSVQ